ncbi:MAG: Na/Pi cotransporter family protein [Pseudobdellovibrionaceae bacterium]|nr:Na/Pi cotransporter family protein [Bdellovibrionales bacterium]USN47913.1 MAG: Na/Pi cotransporter family protein [Pseudobdellovibrionaceae bacterium]
MASIDVWQFLAGLGLFLFGLIQLESSLKLIAGRSFKKFLRKQTGNMLKAILGGTVATAILQSSSVVMLMVLAFVGAGVLDLRHALGVILGSNLGTTFTGWIVAAVGFKVEVARVSLPLLTLGTLGAILFARLKILRQVFLLLAGLGFLFFGLDFMKAGMVDLAKVVDVSEFAAAPAVVFLVLGFVLTAFIQSSSAMMVITLSAIDAGVIPLQAAAAIVIGADLGTTTTAMLGSLGGIPEKKRVALAHFLFNLITDLTAFAVLVPLLQGLTSIVGVSDPLFTLVAFHSAFNFLGILLFIPFLGGFSRFLQNRFKDESDSVGVYLSKVPVTVPEAALEALYNEGRHLMGQVVSINSHVFKLTTSYSTWPSLPSEGGPTDLISSYSFTREYELLKRLEGEILSYVTHLQGEPLQPDESEKLARSLSVVRNSVQAVKCVKDIRHDLEEFESAIDDDVESQYQSFRFQIKEFYEALDAIFQVKEASVVFEELAQLLKLSREQYDQVMRSVHKFNGQARLGEGMVSEVLNVNRELYLSKKATILASKDLLLSVTAARDFDSLPHA